MTESRAGVLERHLQEFETVPAVKSVVLRAITIASRPDSSMAELEQAIHGESAITARILSVVNSAWYGLSRKVESLRTALVSLGINEVLRILVASSASSVDVDAADFDVRRFWVHNIVTAELARQLQGMAKLDDERDLFTAGLMHDIGRLILANAWPESYDRAVHRAQREEVSLLEAERDELAFDHTMLGARLAERWELPEFFVVVMRHVHEGEPPEPFQREIRLLRLADAVARAEGANPSEKEKGEDPFHHPGWEELGEEGSEQNRAETREKLRERVSKTLDFVERIMG